MVEPRFGGGGGGPTLLIAYFLGYGLHTFFDVLVGLGPALKNGEAEVKIGILLIDGYTAPVARQDTEDDGGFPTAGAGCGLKKNATLLEILLQIRVVDPEKPERVHGWDVSCVGCLTEQLHGAGEILGVIRIDGVERPQVEGRHGIVQLQSGFEPMFRGCFVLLDCDAEEVEMSEIGGGGAAACLLGLCQQADGKVLVFADTEPAEVGDRPIDFCCRQSGGGGE